MWKVYLKVRFKKSMKFENIKKVNNYSDTNYLKNIFELNLVSISLKTCYLKLPYLTKYK